MTRQNKLSPKTPRQFKYRFRIEDIAPDGIPVYVQWELFVVGASFFVPCVNAQEAVNQVQETADFFGWVIAYRCGIEGEKWGVRFWRML